MNGQSVESMTEIRTILSNAKSDHKGSAVFTVRRGRYQGQVNCRSEPQQSVENIVEPTNPVASTEGNHLHCLMGEIRLQYKV